MATRDELYRKFGPKLDEAKFRVLFDQINILRSAVSLPGVTVQQAIDAVEAELAGLADYDWT